MIRILTDEVTGAWRSLRGAPGLAMAAVLTLAAGTGAAVIGLTVAWSTLHRSLPVSHPDGLVAIQVGYPGAAAFIQGVPRPEIDAWRARSRQTAGITGWFVSEVTARSEGAPETLRVAVVTDDFFDVVQPIGLRGRPFTPESPGASVVASADWAARSRRGGVDPIGRVLTIGTRALTVTGVAPAALALPDRVDLWVPEQAIDPVAIGSTSDIRSFLLMARVASGLDGQAGGVESDVDRVLREIDDARGRPGSRLARVVPLREHLLGGARPAVVAFAVAACLLLGVACANVASLLVGRASRRSREMAVRLALGASPTALLRAALIESLLLAVAGTAAGLGLAALVWRALRPLTALGLPALATAGLEAPAAVVAGVVALSVSALAGAMPAIVAARTDAAPAFRSATTTGGGSQIVRTTLGVTQIAIAVVLFVGAGLLGRTVTSLLDADLGIDPGAAVALRLRLTETTRFDAAAREPFVRDLVEQVRAIPGVRSAGFGSSLPPSTAQLQMSIRVMTDTVDEAQAFDIGGVTPGYFEAIGARLVQGRWFTDADETGPAVAVLTQSAVRHFGLLGEDPVGRPLRTRLPGRPPGRDRPIVVGVIEDVRHHGLERPAAGGIYVPWREIPTGLGYLVVRPESAHVDVSRAVVARVRQADPSLPVPEVRTLESEVHRSMIARELRLALVGGFALAAGLVALAGLMTMIGRRVIDRRRELAVRAALGATPRQAIAAIAMDGVRITGLGLTIGLGLALLAARGVASLLYGVEPTDLRTYAAVAAGVAATAALATWWPAREAGRVQPVELLKSE